MSDNKVLLTYKDEEGNYQIESLWATKEGDYYRMNNIPFFAPNIALDDIVSVEEDEGELHFDKLIKASGHSTVQMIIFNKSDVVDIGKELESFGCTWEGSHIETLIAIDIPKEIGYSVIKKYLDKGENENRWSYKESCLAHQY
jgi:hypothetical protein